MPSKKTPPKNINRELGRKLALTDQRAKNPIQPTPAQPSLHNQPSSDKREQLSPWKLGGLSVGELARRVWQGINNDDVFGHSAQLAYYFFVALIPGLFFVTAIFGIMAGPGTQLHQSFLQYVQRMMPPASYTMVQKVLNETAAASGGGKLAFGILGALWSATSGMVAVQDTLNAVYDVREGRPLWKTYGLAALMTVACTTLIVLALVVILYGNGLANLIATNVGLGSVITWTWKIAQWPIAFFFLALTFSIVYYFAPDVDQRHWEWLTPGAVVGMVTWIAASFGFRVYLHYFNNYSATYGSLGAVIILLTWFYVTGMMLLLGAEVNAEIENAAANRGLPDAKHKGQKTPSAPQPKSA